MIGKWLRTKRAKKWHFCGHLSNACLPSLHSKCLSTNIAEYTDLNCNLLFCFITARTNGRSISLWCSRFGDWELGWDNHEDGTDFCHNPRTLCPSWIINWTISAYEGYAQSAPKNRLLRHFTVTFLGTASAGFRIRASFTNTAIQSTRTFMSMQ